MTEQWKAIMGFPRFTAAATFSAGATAAGYPASHLGLLPLSMVWRSADLQLANTQFTAVFSTSVPMEMVVLCRHNLSASARVRLRIYSDTGQTLLAYDSN